MFPGSVQAAINGRMPLLRVGLLTALAIILFKSISLLVIYRWLRLDYYLFLVAACALITGLLLNRSRLRDPEASIPAVPGRANNSGSLGASGPADVSGPAAGDLLSLLSAKEILILRLIAEGRTNKEIAAAHFIELSTVKTHINHIYSKLAIGNRREARSRYAETLQQFPVH